MGRHSKITLQTECPLCFVASHLFFPETFPHCQEEGRGLNLWHSEPPTKPLLPWHGDFPGVPRGCAPLSSSLRTTGAFTVVLLSRFSESFLCLPSGCVWALGSPRALQAGVWGAVEN